jgi:hypothetical protein
MSVTAALAPGSRVARRAALALAIGAVALAGSVVLTTAEARAYQSFFTPLFGKPPPDPCSVQGVPPSGGIVVRKQPAIQEGDVPRTIALLCSPMYRMPFGTLLADDAIWQKVMGGSGGAPNHMLQGGLDSVPWKKELSTKANGSYKGSGGNGIGWKDVIAVPADLAQIQTAVGVLFGLPISAPGVIFCLGGAAVTFLPRLGAAVVIGIVVGLIHSPNIINLVGRYFQRNDAMNNGNWFVWSEGAGFFNGFGDVDQSWINPSLFSMADSARMRVGVVFSNVLLNQGPDFDLSKVGSAQTERPQSRRLGHLVRRMERSQGRTRTGSRRGERLFGGGQDDYLFAAGGHDTVVGRRGNDVLLQGARGNDRILGGPGNDNIDGHRGGDLLAGGPGNDQIVDFYGDTTVRTGTGRDLVAVRDGHGGDTVICKGPGRKRILADPSDRIVRAVTGQTGRTACPAGSQIRRHGPLPELGRGY